MTITLNRKDPFRGWVLHCAPVTNHPATSQTWQMEWANPDFWEHGGIQQTSLEYFNIGNITLVPNT